MAIDHSIFKRKRVGFDEILDNLNDFDVMEMIVLAKYGYAPAEVLLKKGFHSVQQAKLVGEITSNILENRGFIRIGLKQRVYYGGRAITLSLFKLKSEIV